MGSNFTISQKLFPIIILFLATLMLFRVSAPAHGQEVTGLNDWSLYIDPGHSQTENMGLYNYSEAEKVLEISLILRDMLEEQTDIEEVFMARTTHEEQVSLPERSSDANATGADFYYSIHSDAGSPDHNSTLMLHGGWRENGETVEKTPEGGKYFGDIMDTVLTDAMRIDRRGNYADRTFYQGFPDSHDNTWPFLHVNRETNMASLLSEGGFHTNPTQQQRNLNKEWWRLEAKAAFWTILEFHEIERPEVGIATGFITDSQSGETLNGVTVTIGDKTYTTDTYESRFHEFSDDPDELSNGFYYIDGLEPGSEVEVTFDSPDHFEKTVTATLEDQDFTFIDVELESRMPPKITEIQARTPVDSLMPGDDLEITFDRMPDPDTFEDAVSFSPESPLTHWMEDDYTLMVSTDSLEYQQDYTLTISDKVLDKENGKPIDGNNDGEPGGDFILELTTSPPDTDPPALVETYPAAEVDTDVLRPVIRLVFDKAIEEESLADTPVTVLNQGNGVEGTSDMHTVGNNSVIHFYPTEDLVNDQEYTVEVQSGLSDRFGNTAEEFEFNFNINAPEIDEISTIDDFNGGISGWWEPQQSGSTTGIQTDLTSVGSESGIVNKTTGSQGSMKLNYGWDTGASEHLLREYLPPDASQNLRFDDSYILQAYVFGDGSGNQFRFMLRDGNQELEGSEWYTIHWIGWKRVTWDLSEDPVVGWVNGDGQLDGQLYTDSFQLSFAGEGAAESGTLFIDDYAIVDVFDPTSTDPIAEKPDEFHLGQNYPNPFNPATTIDYKLPESSQVELTVYTIEGREVQTLVNEQQEAGSYSVNFDASNLASGTYIYRIQTENFSQTEKMLFIK